jgi:tetratricopeptide (TPR) repeat protein
MAPVAVWFSLLFIMSETHGADAVPVIVRKNQTAAGLRPIRLAIGGFAGPTEGATTQKANAQLLDLLTVKLGGTKQIELVERTAMERVLKEITLSASQSERTVAAGKLLRADWLLLGSWIRVETTNQVVVRLVEARTGVILDFASVTFADPNVEPAAESIAGFVQSVPVTSSSDTQWVLLGIGGFENLGINERHRDLRKELRAVLEVAFRNTHIRTVERTMVSPLLEEFRLAQGGFTGEKKLAATAQPAFFLLDGVYQGLQQETAKLNLVLRLQKIGGTERLLTFKAPPGPQLYAEVVEAISKSVRELQSTPATPSRHAEALTQMERGKERSRLPGALSVNSPLGGLRPGREDEKRLRNITEAIEAFQTALLLDPDCAEAKFYLADCFLNGLIGKTEAARDFLSELMASQTDASIHFRFTIGGLTNHPVKILAKWKLAESYVGEDDPQAFDLFRALERDAPNRSDLNYWQWQLAGVLERLAAQQRVPLEEVTGFYDKRVWPLCEDAELKLRQGGMFDIVMEAMVVNHFSCIARAYRFDKVAAERYLRANFLPTVKGKWPRLLLYVEMKLLTWSVNPSPEAIAEFKSSLASAAQGTGEVSPPQQWSPEFFRFTLNWALLHKEYGLVEQLAAWRTNDTRRSLLPFDAIQLGYAYREQGKWRAALAQFEAMERGVLSVPAAADGPWGRAWNTTLIPAKLADECRQQLGRNAKNPPPGRLELSPPRFTLRQPFAFATDGSRLWIGDGPVPCVYDELKDELIPLEPSFRSEHEITAVCVGADRVWFGTADGLLEFDPGRNTWRRYTENDGLLLPRITALAAGPDRLWIGFGKGDRGGLGYLDLKRGKLVGFSTEFDAAAVTNGLTGLRPKYFERASGVPRDRVVGVVLTYPNEVWAGVRHQGLVQHSSANNTWKTSGTINCDSLWCVAGNSNFVACGGIGNNGGLVYRNFRTGRAHRPILANWLPNDRVRSVAIDCDRAWLGGLGWLAVMDLTTETVLKTKVMTEAKLISEISADVKINQIQTDERNVWIEVGSSLVCLQKTTETATR